MLTTEPSHEDIELEQPDIWPQALRQLIEENKKLLLAYHHETKRIERLCQNDIRARIDPPPNPHRPEYEDLVLHAESLLADCRLVGFHCTRITPSETERIRAEGLRALSASLLREKLEALVDAGEMSLKQSQFFLNSPEVETNLANRVGDRTGLVWMCANRSTLSEGASVYRLFRSWGGEALYGGFENGASNGEVLKRIGRPAIIQCAIPLPINQLYGCYATRFFSKAVSQTISYPEPSPYFDCKVARDLDPSEIMDIIHFDDPRFKALTSHQNWRVQHRIF